jgi:hypothetical protein
LSILGIPHTYLVSTIFRTIETDAKGLSNQLGILGKSFKTIKTDLSQGFGIGFSLFGGNGKGISQSDISAINAYYRELDNCVSKQTAWNRTMLNTSKAAQSMVINANGARISTEQLGQAQELTTWQTIKLTAASVALNAAISLGVGVLLSLAIKIFTHLYNIQDKLAEKTKELTSSLKSQTDEYNNLKSELDEVNKKLKDNESRYSELIEKQKESGLTTEESDELEELQRITGELTNQKNILEENIRLKKESAASTAQELANTLLKQEDVKSFMDGAGGKIKSFFNEIQELSIKMIPRFGKLYSAIDTVISLFNIEIPKDSWLNKIANIFDGTAIISWLTGTDIEEDSYDEAVSKYEALQKKMKAIRDKYDKNGDGIIDSNSSMSSEDSQSYKKYYDESVEVANSLKTEYQELDDAIKAIEADPNLTQVNKEELERLRAARDIIAEILGYNNEGKTGDGIISDEDVKNANEMTVSIGELEGASDKIKTLSSAFKELSDDGYITTKTLGELQTATGLSGDEWEEYENRLLNAKKGSADFNQVLSELTYKILENEFATVGLENVTEEQIAAILRENNVVNANTVAHDISSKAKMKARISAENLVNATDEQIKKLAEEGKVFGLTENALKTLRAAYVVAQKDMTEITSNAVLSRLKLLKEEVKGIKNVATAYAAITTSRSRDTVSEIINFPKNSKSKDAMRSTLPFSTNYVPLSSDEQLLLQYGQAQEKIQDIIDNFDLDFKNLGFSNPSSGSSSAKNEALDNYLKDAENRYKIHQDETKYINDLNYALFNLVKTKDEELDVTGKINEAYRDLADNRIKDLEHQIDLTKELKGEDANVIDQLNEIQRVSHDEANRLRDMGYDDNSNEIQDLQKTWWDAQNEKLDFYQKQHDIVIKDIEHARDMALNADENANVNTYYKQLQDEYHREAERLRALDPEKYKEDIQKLQQLWWDAQNEMLDYNKQVIDDFLNKLQEELDKSFDIRISRLNSKSSLLSSHFNIVNAIAEEQHNLNKELREAETIGARMSELERETLFSKADHNKLSSKLSDIMVDITDLQSDYLRDLEHATEDTIEEVTNQYERQYELKMKEYEIVRAELNLIRKQQILENTRNEKSVRTWNGSEWVYEANLQDVLNAQEEVENAKYELARAQAEEAQQTALSAIDASADALQTEKNKLTSAIEDMAEKMSGSGKEITSMLQTLAETDLPTFDAIIKAFGDSIKEAANISDKDISKYRSDSVVLNRMKARSDAWHTASGSEKEALAEANRIDGERLGLTRDASGVWRKKDGSRAYASGTPNAKKGIGLFDEKGFGSEVILTNDGILTQFNGGERVFSPEMADRLWEIAQKNNILTASVPQLDFSKLVPIEERINNAISNISNVSGDTYMIKDVTLSESEGGTLKGFINFLKKKI